MTGLVILPGLDGSAGLSSDFVAAARSSFSPIVVISYPTHEVMNYEQLAAYVRGFLPEQTRYVLLGQSFSGPIALAIAASRPDGLIGLVLSTTFCESALPCLSPFAPLLRFAPVRALPRRLLSWCLLGRWTQPELVSKIQHTLDAVGADVLRSRAASALSVDASRHLEHIPMPVLYLRATEERLLSRHASARILKETPLAEEVAIAGPHLLLQCAPQACAEATERFRAKLDAGHVLHSL
jgi:pimeloyl-ACP methyl ester carboxylesterase